jgi:N6-adenosine-specific RNA methylase IME4
MIFAPLPTVEGGWRCVSCDAPLHFGTWSAKGQGRAPSRHYGTHSPEEVMTLPLEAALARDAWLFLWWPDPHLPSMIQAMEALGFEFSGKAFTWIKTLKSLSRGPRVIPTNEIGRVLHMGCGKTTRKNSETCWLGRRGSPEILSHGVREVIVAPVREHSRKPDEAYARTEIFCPGPRLDLFGRQSREGWTVYGAEADKFDREGARQCRQWSAKGREWRTWINLSLTTRATINL